VRDDRVRLSDILEAFARIEKYTDQPRDALYSDELLQINGTSSAICRDDRHG
jgi:uncharacterized protein with HEPN domain